MVVAGAATALKRTLLAISFGRRQYSTFKPRLESLLLDVFLLNEGMSILDSLAVWKTGMFLTSENTQHAVATLSAFVEGLSEENEDDKRATKPKRAALSEVKWGSVRMKDIEGLEAFDSGRDFEYRQSSSTVGGSLLAGLDRWTEPAKHKDKVRPQHVTILNNCHVSNM